jgi:ligand-binding SRPBCC domain-containing protein
MMTIIKIETIIKAPVTTCFDLSRSLDLHKLSQANAREQAIDGKTRGLLGPGETVTWEATHLMARRQMTVAITQFKSPDTFTDEMISGPFLSMKHIHAFKESGDKTLMSDEFSYEVPGGWFGKIFDDLFLRSYMLRLLEDRNAFIKQIAESIQANGFFK